MTRLQDNFNGNEIEPKTLFNIQRKGNHLFAYFEAYDSSLKSYSNKNNDDLWKLNAVEIFIEINDSDSYLEIEVAPNGATFVASILNRKITFIDDSFLKASVNTKESTYFVEMDIDLSKFNPKKIRYNAFRLEVISGIQILEALSPTYCDTFHVKEKFIDL